MIITKKEFDYIKDKEDGKEFFLDVDLGLRRIKVKREKDKAILEGETLDLREKLKDKFCYRLYNHHILPIAFFSQKDNHFYKLTLTSDWPTISIGSVPMHKLSSPYRDTKNKIDLLKPFGCVLDTCMGLGYTAILAAQRVKRVITFERDENVFLIAENNPFSQKLFFYKNIEIKKEDVFLGIKQFKDNCFDCVIHDPPTFKLAPHLYSEAFYKELFRVINKGGRFFHYTPFYKIKRGYDFPSKVKGKLKEAGFAIIKFSPEAGGLLCRKI